LTAAWRKNGIVELAFIDAVDIRSEVSCIISHYGSPECKIQWPVKVRQNVWFCRYTSVRLRTAHDSLHCCVLSRHILTHVIILRLGYGRLN
jgi:hypothetical protein